MTKSSSKDNVRVKDRAKVYTRAQAEKALARGADPSQFMSHKNYHVKALAWKKMGRPLPEDATERAKFLASIHVQEKPATVTEEMAPVEA